MLCCYPQNSIHPENSITFTKGCQLLVLFQQPYVTTCLLCALCSIIHVGNKRTIIAWKKQYCKSLIRNNSVKLYQVHVVSEKLVFRIYFLHSEKIIQMPLDWANDNQSKIWFCQIKNQEFCHLTLDYQFFIWIRLLAIK